MHITPRYAFPPDPALADPLFALFQFQPALITSGKKIWTYTWYTRTRPSLRWRGAAACVGRPARPRNALPPPSRWLSAGHSGIETRINCRRVGHQAQVAVGGIHKLRVGSECAGGVAALRDGVGERVRAVELLTAGCALLFTGWCCSRYLCPARWHPAGHTWPSAVKGRVDHGDITACPPIEQPAAVPLRGQLSLKTALATSRLPPLW